MEIPVAGLISLFQTMYREHWSYVWGAARDGCVDCSGAFVWAYTRYGLKIAHGSNAIARQYVAELLPIEKAEPGMAAFKYREPGQKGYALPERYASSSDKRDYYHIGLVDDDPEWVLNAKSTSAGFSRDKLSKWGCVARLKAVDYNTATAEEKTMEPMIVTCTPGETVRLRSKASTSSDYIEKIPNGTEVEAGPEDERGWRVVKHGGKQGFMLSAFLKPAPTASTTDGETVTITLPYDAAMALRDALIGVMGVG